MFSKVNTTYIYIIIYVYTSWFGCSTCDRFKNCNTNPCQYILHIYVRERMHGDDWVSNSVGHLLNAYPREYIKCICILYTYIYSLYYYIPHVLCVATRTETSRGRSAGTHDYILCTGRE